MRFSILIILLVLTSCSIKHRNSTDSEIYIQEFKLRYFKELLKNGFNNDKGYNDATGIDRSHYAEIILRLEDYNYIDSLAVAGNQFMVIDSIKSYHYKAEGAHGKKVFHYALEKFNSKWLDSIARKRYKLFRKKEI